MIQQRSIDPSAPRLLVPPSGEWLVKIRGEIIGPVPAPEVIQRMFTGEVDEQTEMSVPEEGIWRPVETWHGFHPFLIQAKARLQIERRNAEIARVRRRARNRARLRLSMIAVGFLLGSFALSFAVMILRPWDLSLHVRRVWAEKHLPLVKLLPVSAVAERGKEESPTGAQEDGISIDQILIDDQPELVAIRADNGERKPHAGARPAEKKKVAMTLDQVLGHKGAGKNGGKEPDKDDVITPGKSAEDNLLSNEEIMAVVYKKKNLQGLAHCVRQETKAGKEFPGTLVVSFTINNDGRVGQVRMEDDNLDNSNLHRCFQQQLTKLKFREYVGERRNVDIPIKVGR